MENKTLKIGVLASGEGTNFQTVVDAVENGKIKNAEVVVLIYNVLNAPVAYRASKHGIDHTYIDHRSYKRESFDERIVAFLKLLNVDMVIMAGWMRIATSVLVNAYPRKIINIHPSLLPDFKGKDAVKQALESTKNYTGCTAHLVELEVDGGQILVQAEVPILLLDTVETLHKRIKTREPEVLIKAINVLQNVDIGTGHGNIEEYSEE